MRSLTPIPVVNANGSHYDNQMTLTPRTPSLSDLPLDQAGTGEAAATARGGSATATALPCCAAVARIWRSGELLGSHSEIQIDHHGALYRLRVTTLGKLILTK